LPSDSLNSGPSPSIRTAPVFQLRATFATPSRTSHLHKSAGRPCPLRPQPAATSSATAAPPLSSQLLSVDRMQSPFNFPFLSKRPHPPENRIDNVSPFCSAKA